MYYVFFLSEMLSFIKYFMRFSCHKENIAIAKYAFKIAARFILTASGKTLIFLPFQRGFSNATKSISLLIFAT